MPIPIDMTGTQPRWPAEVSALWRAGMARESAASDAWNSASRQGDPGLREVLAELLDDQPERLAITSGVRSAAGVLSRGVRRVIHERPSFAGTVQTFRSFGTPVTLAGWDELTGAVHDTELADRALLWVTRPARNPDGATLDLARWRQLRALAAGRLRVVVNEVYRWHVLAETDRDGPDVTTVGSLAKLAGTGSALGWIRVDDAPAVVAFHPSRPPLLWQRCWRYLLERGALECFVESSVLPAQRAAQVFLRDLGMADRFTTPPPFVLLAVSGLDAADLLARLAENGIAAGPGPDFLAPMPAVRLAFAGLTEERAERAAAVIHREFVDRCHLLTP